MDAGRLLEVCTFSCQACGSTWDEQYEIRQVRDSRGFLQGAFFLLGVRVASPLTQAVCRACGDRQVRILRHSRRRASGPGES